MAETFLYTQTDRRGYISAPQFIRSRARYRGQRESFKINTEIAQLLYDLRKLYEKYDTLKVTLDARLYVLEHGGSISGATYGTSDEAFVIPGVEELAVRLTRLRERVGAL